MKLVVTRSVCKAQVLGVDGSPVFVPDHMMENHPITIGSKVDWFVAEVTLSPMHSSHTLSGSIGESRATDCWLPVGTSIRGIVPSGDGTCAPFHVNVSSEYYGVVVLAATTTKEAVCRFGTAHVMLTSIARQSVVASLPLSYHSRSSVLNGTP